MAATPKFIGLPEPISAPDTPTEMPGTPNSGTTSLSALSTTAIKDGHRGSSFPHSGTTFQQVQSSNTLEAERADRISRLAGLERVSAVRSQNPGSSLGVNSPGPGPAYFDATGNPVLATRMSTVGTASATGSAGGRTTTWASGSLRGQDDDDMSMSTNERDIDQFSVSASAQDEEDGMSDDTSLVGFGEGAGSTVSGPTYTRNSNLQANSALGRPGLSNLVESAGTPGSFSTTGTTEQQIQDLRMTDAVADDTSSGYIDTAARGGGVPVSRGSGIESVEKIIDDRLGAGDGQKPPLGSPNEAGLGKFYFEEKKP